MPLPTPKSMRRPAMVDDGGPDRHVEPRSPVRLHVADRAGVDAARARLERAHNCHGADFGRSGHRRRRVQGGKELRQRRRRARRDQRRHLPDVGIALDGEKLRHRDAADVGDPSEVVAHHVDDHHVLGALLRGLEQLGPLQGVFARPFGRAPTVPFIGRAVRWRPSRAKNSSGEAEQIEWAPR